MDGRILAFTGLVALLTVTPGADMALVTRSVLSSGRRAAFLTTLGISAGILGWAAASAVGVASVLAASATAFAALKLAGAAYLVALGLTTLWSARRTVAAAPAHDTPSGPGSTAGAPSDGAAFRQGLLTNVLNPKIAILYSALLPQFIAPGRPVLASSMLLAGIHVSLGIAWLSAYAQLLSRAGAVLRRARVRLALERATGAVLVGLGLGVALQRR